MNKCAFAGDDLVTEIHRGEKRDTQRKKREFLFFGIEISAPLLEMI